MFDDYLAQYGSNKSRSRSMNQLCKMSTSVTAAADIADVLSRLNGSEQLSFKLTGGEQNMTSNFIVPSGARIFLDGSGRKLLLSGKQFIVEANATLLLFNIHLEEGRPKRNHWNGADTGPTYGRVEGGGIELESGTARLDFVVPWFTS
jgi:hypothetical protein